MPSLAGIYTGTLTEANGKVDVAQLILILNDKAFPKTPALSGTLSVCLLTKTCFNPGKTKEEQQAADEDTFTVGLLNDFKFDTTKSLLNLSFGIPGSTEVVGTVVGNTLLQLNVTGPRLRGKVSTTISNKVGFVDLTKIK